MVVITKSGPEYRGSQEDWAALYKYEIQQLLMRQAWRVSKCARAKCGRLFIRKGEANTAIPSVPMLKGRAASMRKKGRYLQISEATMPSGRRRRGQNEGVIHYRADGRWEARLNLGWHDAKRVRKSYFAATREEVAKLLAAAKAEHDRGVPIPHSGITVGRYLTDWLETVRSSVRPRTYESYELHVRHHVNPEIGNVRLSALRPEHVRGLLKRKLDSGLSPQTVVTCALY